MGEHRDGARLAASESRLARAPPARPRAVDPAELAWIALVPCAVALLAAIVVLGPILGHAFLGPGSETLWPPNLPSTQGRPEPVKHARYVIALLGPVLLGAVVLAGARRPPRLRPTTIRTLVLAAQALTLLFLAAAVLGQNNVMFHYLIPLWPIFPVGTMIAASALTAAALVVLRVPGVARRIPALVRETRPRRIAGVVVAGLAAAVWLAPAIVTDRLVGDTEAMWWTIDDAFAVLNGRTPLVDFHALYAQLWPYPAAAAMGVLGTSVAVYAIAMVSMSGLTLLAAYAVLRRVVRSSLLALLLYLPFLATGFLRVEPPSAGGHGASTATLFAIWPMRYGGAYLLAWLTARHLDGAGPRRAWLLFLAAGLVALDNLEFGLGALVATFVALACARPPRSRQALARLLASAAIGLLGAAALVALLTLVRAGELPHAEFILEFPRIFGVLGLVSQPMPSVGFHLVVYATFAAAIAAAVVRVASGDEDRLLTGMLAWSGVFGLLASSYYVGRSDAAKLIAMFSAWSFALALLCIVVVRGLAARGWRRPSVAALAVLFGFGLAVCSVRDLPTPWSQVARLRQTVAPAVYQPTASKFVAQHTRAGERVAILIPLGHRVAYELGITNVAPYSFIEEMVTRRQMGVLLDAVRKARAHRVFVPNEITSREQVEVLAQAGFSQRAARGPFSEWSDARAR